ncbi:MAG: siderophore-interacting protein [Kofleriaceae bacterium]|nr:siderophore-interacting protein [Kofleriaceae bacterium]
MSSVKGLLLDAVGRFALRDAKVVAVREVGPVMRAIELTGEKLRAVDWVPGDKIQILLPSKDVRTYTPTRWDSRAGTTEILAYHHGTSPGSAWSRATAVGDTVRFVGPQRSLRRASSSKHAILFGDETSFGVACALAGVDATTLHGVLEVTSRGEAEPVVTACGAHVDLVERRAADAHLDEVTQRLVALLAAHPGAELLMTGRAQSIQAVRARLRDSGVRPRDQSKPYWSVGKAGLD